MHAAPPAPNALLRFLERPHEPAPEFDDGGAQATGDLVRALESRGGGALSHTIFAFMLRQAVRDRGGITGMLRNVASVAPERLRAVAAALGDDGADAAPLALDQLNLTLARAHRTTARYRDPRFGCFAPDVEAFRALPRLTRRDVDADIMSICVGDAPPDFFTATSATTTGRSLLVPHSHAELAALSRLATPDDAMRDGAADDVGPMGMTLRLMPAGRLIGAPAGSSASVLATYDTNAIRENVWDTWDYIIGQVFVEFPTARGLRAVDTVHATPAFGLILLTKYMLDRGLRPSESAVRTLIATGSWLGRHTRAWMEQAWNAEVYTTYSCSELNGSAVECPHRPGRYHFSRNIFPEVLDDEAAHVEPGRCGAIHLTGLYPFHQCAAFVRYEIGDWGRWLGHGRCSCGEVAPTLDMLGRTRDVLRLRVRDGRVCAVAPVPVRNALDRFAFVPKIPRPQHRLSVEPGVPPTLVVDVECYALAGPSWRAAASDDIATAILAEDPDLADLVRSGEVALRVALHFRSAISQTTSVI